jgi:hypothetical protein
VTTLEEMLDAVERKHGRARRVWVFDRGIVSEENLQSLRRAGASYLVGTPRAQLKAYERRLLEGDWQRVSGEVEVQLIAQDKETYVLARSQARAQKESAMRLRVVRGTNARFSSGYGGCFAMAGLKTRPKSFSKWADSRSVTSKPGDT